jgi:hypothetical protein
LALLFTPVVWWWSCGESFLSLTQRLPAEVLVVEGWIGRDGIRAAAAEFEQRGYRYVVASGGLSSAHWEKDPLNYAQMADGELIRLGVPKDKIIVAPSRITESRRTYESAAAVWHALQAKGLRPNSLNVFTFGAHARRSRLVFAKVEGPGTKVGVVSWSPSDYEGVPWWRSSERARELMLETVGYLFEALLNSGRSSNSPGDDASLRLGIQGNYAVPSTAQTTVTVPYTGAQTAGNLNVAVVGWNDTTAKVRLAR